MLHRNMPTHCNLISYHMLLPHDLTAHLCRLDPQERSLLFFAAVNDVYIAKQVRGNNWCKAVVVGAFQGGHLVGAAELFGTANGAELAVTVDHRIQGSGVGTELVRKALLVAKQPHGRKVQAASGDGRRWHGSGHRR